MTMNYQIVITFAATILVFTGFIIHLHWRILNLQRRIDSLIYHNQLHEKERR